MSESNMHRDGLGRLSWPTAPTPAPEPPRHQPMQCLPTDRMKIERFEYDLSLTRTQMTKMQSDIAAILQWTRNQSTAITDPSPLINQVAAVVTAISDGTLSDKQFQQIDKAMQRYKQDRAIRNIAKKD